MRPQECACSGWVSRQFDGRVIRQCFAAISVRAQRGVAIEKALAMGSRSLVIGPAG